jgi:hypothetical protein
MTGTRTSDSNVACRQVVYSFKNRSGPWRGGAISALSGWLRPVRFLVMTRLLVCSLAYEVRNTTIAGGTS